MTRIPRHRPPPPLATLLAEIACVCGSPASDLSLLDRTYQVERLLLALGWNLSDPLEVTRTYGQADATVTLQLSIARIRSFAVVVRERLSSEEPNSVSGVAVDWVATTDGLEWRVRPGSEPASWETISINGPNAGDRLQEYISRRAHAVGLIDRREARRRVLAFLESEIARMLEEFPDMEKQILARLAQFGSDSPALPEILGILLPTAQRATLTARAEAARLKLATGRPWLAANTPGGDVVWPEDATHMLRRKGCASFIRYSPERQRVDLLRGSVMLAATRSSFPRYHKALRNDALMQGYFVQDGDLIRVIHACPLDTPSTAATLVSGTVDNGWTSWRDREGKPIPRAPGRQTPRLTREVQIEDETADAERPAAAERRSNR